MQCICKEKFILFRFIFIKIQSVLIYTREWVVLYNNDLNIQNVHPEIKLAWVNKIPSHQHFQSLHERKLFHLLQQIKIFLGHTILFQSHANLPVFPLAVIRMYKFSSCCLLAKDENIQLLPTYLIQYD